MTRTLRTMVTAMAAAATLAVAQGVEAAPPAQIVGEGALRIVSPDWLAGKTGQPGFAILDVRTSVADYQRGHVPGAVFLANDALRAPIGGLPVQYLDGEALAGLFRRAGVDPDETVVVYADGGDVLGATMAAYCLQKIGHDKVAILDGGIEAYRQRHPLTQAYPDVSPGTIEADVDGSIAAGADDVRAALGSATTVILDTRPAEAYLGNTTRWMRNGHIPGAVNLDWHFLMAPDNPHDFKDVETMRRLIEATGARPEDEVIVYCGTSREATLVHQVMTHILGYSDVRLYEGSWTEWCSLTSMPLETSGLIVTPAALAHRAPTTSELEPYSCGTVERLHTVQGFFLASQPSPDDFEQAKMGGVRTVVNMRHPNEADFNEREVVEGLGLEYYNPGWNGPEELTDSRITEMVDLLRTVERPVLVHCSSANRVGAIWLAYSVLERDLSWDEALAEAKTVGLKSPDYERIVRGYLEDRGALSN